MDNDPNGVTRLMAKLVVVVGLVILIGSQVWPTAQHQAQPDAKCPPWARAVGDPRWTYWRIHYKTGYHATNGWGKWHCEPKPVLTYKDAS